jgi:type IV secretory pathway VirB4 component
MNKNSTNSYQKLIKKIGGEIIKINPESGTLINPLEIPEND